MTPARKPHVLILAFTCQPGLGSEYEVGWRWSLAVPPEYRCTILTRKACWSAIPGPITFTEGREQKIVEGRSYHYVDLPGAERVFERRRLMRMHFLIWQVLALSFARARRGSYDVVHPVSFVSVWMPSLAAFSGLPFVWGPLGTNNPMPRWYARARNLRIRIRALAWHLVTQVSPLYNPVLWACQRRARYLIAINQHIVSLLRPDVRDRTIVHPAIGSSEEMIARPLTSATADDPHVLFAGRYLVAKMPELALAAAQLVLAEHPTARFTMVGEGLPEVLGEPAQPRIRIRGHVSQREAWDMMASARVFLFPSVEGSGQVALEAMAHGVPLVCVENSGPAEFAGTAGGIAVPIADSEQETARRLADAVLTILRDEALWARLSAGARERVARFRWENATDVLREIYESTLRSGAADHDRHALVQPGAISRADDPKRARAGIP